MINHSPSWVYWKRCAVGPSGGGGSSDAGCHASAADERGSGRGASWAAARWDGAGAAGCGGAGPACDVAAVGAWVDGMVVVHDAGAGREEAQELIPCDKGQKKPSTL